MWARVSILKFLYEWPVQQTKLFFFNCPICESCQTGNSYQIHVVRSENITSRDGCIPSLMPTAVTAGRWASPSSVIFCLFLFTSFNILNFDPSELICYLQLHSWTAEKPSSWFRGSTTGFVPVCVHVFGVFWRLFLFLVFKTVIIHSRKIKICNVQLHSGVLAKKTKQKHCNWERL